MLFAQLRVITYQLSAYPEEPKGLSKGYELSVLPIATRLAACGLRPVLTRNLEPATRNLPLLVITRLELGIDHTLIVSAFGLAVSAWRRRLRAPTAGSRLLGGLIVLGACLLVKEF
jgi:hypothetical protein